MLLLVTGGYYKQCSGRMVQPNIYNCDCNEPVKQAFLTKHKCFFKKDYEWNGKYVIVGQNVIK